MCELCDNISKLSKTKEGPFDWSDPEKNENQIVSNDEGFHIWHDGGGDTFQSGFCIKNIKYCPVCGRKL